MKSDITIVSQPLHLPEISVEGCGAVASFLGRVRGKEGESEVAGLFYEAYQPMAERVMATILHEINCSHPFELARVHHRTGFVPTGEAAIMIDVHSKHRAEAFAVVQIFMDRLKKEVPIWKVNSKMQRLSVALGE